MPNSWNTDTTATDVAKDLQTQIEGKNVLITGTSVGGIGFEVARAIARHANLVILAGVNGERLEHAIATIQSETPSANLRKLVVDLGSFNHIRLAAAEVNGYNEPIHVIINNAISTPVDQHLTSTDGFEAQFAIGHLGHFLFIALILPSLRAALTSTPRYIPRVVAVSSLWNIHAAPIDYEDINWKANPSGFTKWGAYNRVKAANVMFASELACRAKSGTLLAFSIYPGTSNTTGTDLIPVQEKIAFGLLDKDGKEWDKWKYKTREEAAAPYLVAAFDPALEDKSGSFISDDCQVHNDADHIVSFALDPEERKKLWEFSEKVVGVKFSVE